MTDWGSYNGLAVGDWCVIPESHDITSDNYQLKGAADWKTILNTPRIILAFFELKAVVPRIKRRVTIRRIFCATGVAQVKEPKYPKPIFGFVNRPRTMLVDRLDIEIDNMFVVEGRLYYAKLFQADFLKKFGKEDLPKEQEK